MISLLKFSSCISTGPTLNSDLGHVRSTQLIKSFFLNLSSLYPIKTSSTTVPSVFQSNKLDIIFEYYSTFSPPIFNWLFSKLNFKSSSPCHLSSDHCKNLFSGISPSDLSLSNPIFALARVFFLKYNSVHLISLLNSP